MSTIKNRGISAKCLDLIRIAHENDKKIWSRDIAAHFRGQCSDNTVYSAINYLYNTGKVHKEGVQGCYSYTPIESEDTSSPEDGEDVIENLLTAMAAAEPLLRQLQAAQKAFTQYHKGA